MKLFCLFLFLLASPICEHLSGLRHVELWGDVCEVGVSEFLLPQVFLNWSRFSWIQSGLCCPVNHRTSCIELLLHDNLFLNLGDHPSY